jgi:hypothetical protein
MATSLTHITVAEPVRRLQKQELAALEAAARHFSAGWQLDEEPPGTWLAIGQKRIAMEITTMEHRIAGAAGTAKPRLRFDRVALRLIEHLQVTVRDAVPHDRTVVVTVTAPIRLSAKTAAVLEVKIAHGLAHRPAALNIKETIHGNETRARLLKVGLSGASRLIGFVHNPETDADVLFDMTRSLIDSIAATTASHKPAAADRWLVLLNGDGPAHIGTYRDVYSQLSIPNKFGKILMVFAQGRVETLSP